VKLSLRIPLILTIIVDVTGFIAYIKIAVRGGAFSTVYFVAWIVVSLILVGITIWSWLRNKKK